MTQLKADYRQLAASAQKHEKAINVLKPSSSKSLLLFYAVECALKSVVLKEAQRHNPQNSDTSFLQQEKKFGTSGHDLLMGLKAIPNLLKADLGSAPTNLRSGDSSYGLDKAHQAWRYGVPLHQEDESKAIVWLGKLAAKLKHLS